MMGSSLIQCPHSGLGRNRRRLACVQCRARARRHAPSLVCARPPAARPSRSYIVRPLVFGGLLWCATSGAVCYHALPVSPCGASAVLRPERSDLSVESASGRVIGGVSIGRMMAVVCVGQHLKCTCWFDLRCFVAREAAHRPRRAASCFACARQRDPEALNRPPRDELMSRVCVVGSLALCAKLLNTRALMRCEPL